MDAKVGNPLNHEQWHFRIVTLFITDINDMQRLKNFVDKLTLTENEFLYYVEARLYRVLHSEKLCTHCIGIAPHVFVY